MTTTILPRIPRNARPALCATAHVLAIFCGCSDDATLPVADSSYESVALGDASLAVASETAPDEELLCSLGIGQTHYVFARAILGSPSVSLRGSYLHYVYGSQPSISEGLQAIGMTFGPGEVFEGATTDNLPKPSCWAQAEIENEFRRKELPPIVQASTLLQSPDDYPPVPSEDRLCQIVIGRTLAKDVWFDILTSGFMRRLQMGPRDSVINFRYGDRESDRVVSLYFYFAAADPTEDNDLFFALDKIVAYNLAALPACWR